MRNEEWVGCEKEREEVSLSTCNIKEKKNKGRIKWDVCWAVHSIKFIFISFAFMEDFDAF